MNENIAIDVYRFRDAVAINTPGGTVYLTPAEADELGKQIRFAGQDIEQVRFSQSTFSTYTAKASLEYPVPDADLVREIAP